MFLGGCSSESPMGILGNERRKHERERNIKSAIFYQSFCRIAGCTTEEDTKHGNSAICMTRKALQNDSYKMNPRVIVSSRV